MLYLSLTTYANTGGGQTRVVLTHGSTETQLDEWDCPAGQWTGRTVEHPLDGLHFLWYFGLRIEHRNKSTGQNCETRLWSAYTRNTFTEAEAPDVPLTETANAARAMPAAAMPAEEV